MNEMPEPLTGQTCTSSSSTSEHSSLEWDKQRGRFTRLYIVEDRALTEVRSIMESQYGFSATERQYKRKIVAWKLDKNVKDGDMKLMLRKQLKRKLDGKESEFQVYGRPVPPQKMSRFVQRKGITHDEILAEDLPTPSHITCHTPSAAEDEEDLGDVGTLNGALRSPSPQPLDLVNEQDPPQISKNDAKKTQGGINQLVTSELTISSSIKPLPSIRSLIVPSKPEDESVVADQMALFTAKMSCFLISNARPIMEAEDERKFWRYARISTIWSPTADFLDWTKTVLRTTQISDNAIQLALLYMNRLKKADLIVNSARGSERRWLTCALMLSNKFLDDHVYTNKTWADVCGIDIKELNVMEVEFIRAIQCDLLATKDQWTDWRATMEYFYEILSETRAEARVREPPYPSVESSFLRLQLSDLPYSDGSIVNGNVIFLPERPMRATTKTAHLQALVPNMGLEYVSAGSPVIRRVHDLGSSPFERCSPRYHLSMSPDYYRRDITSTNPLSFLSPFPISSSSVNSTPILTSSLDTTAHPLKAHQMYYRNIESSKENIQTGMVRNELPSITEIGLIVRENLSSLPIITTLELQWPPLTEADGFAF